MIIWQFSNSFPTHPKQHADNNSAERHGIKSPHPLASGNNRPDYIKHGQKPKSNRTDQRTAPGDNQDYNDSKNGYVVHEQSQNRAPETQMLAKNIHGKHGEENDKKDGEDPREPAEE